MWPSSFSSLCAYSLRVRAKWGGLGCVRRQGGVGQTGLGWQRHGLACRLQQEQSSTTAMRPVPAPAPEHVDERGARRCRAARPAPPSPGDSQSPAPTGAHLNTSMNSAPMALRLASGSARPLSRPSMRSAAGGWVGGWGQAGRRSVCQRQGAGLGLRVGQPLQAAPHAVCGGGGGGGGERGGYRRGGGRRARRGTRAAAVHARHAVGAPRQPCAPASTPALAFPARGPAHPRRPPW